MDTFTVKREPNLLVMLIGSFLTLLVIGGFLLYIVNPILWWLVTLPFWGNCWAVVWAPFWLLFATIWLVCQIAYIMFYGSPILAILIFSLDYLARKERDRTAALRHFAFQLRQLRKSKNSTGQQQLEALREALQICLAVGVKSRDIQNECSKVKVIRFVGIAENGNGLGSLPVIEIKFEK